MSKKTNDAQRKYTSYELEILAVIGALVKFKVHLLGIQTKTFTKTLEKQNPCTRVARWVLFFQEYDYEVEHRSGTRMKHVDALSRYPIMTILDQSISIGIQKAQEQPEHHRAVCDFLNNGKDSESSHYFLWVGILQKLDNDTELILVPKDMKRQIITIFLEKKVQKVLDCYIPCIMSNHKKGKQD